MGRMKIAILSNADVAGWYFATLQERGHKAMFVDGNPSTALKQLVQEGSMAS